MITRLFLVCALCLSIVPASADDVAQANKLLVEAVKLIQAAGTEQTPSEQIPLLEDALDKLNEIVKQHPTSDLAVKLITGQQIGNISLTELADAIENLKLQTAHDDAMADRGACLQSLDANDPKCSMWLPDIVRIHLQNGNIDSALNAAMTAAPGYDRDNMLFEIARNQAQTGDIKEALATTESIATQMVRDTALHEVGVNQAAIVGTHLQKGNLTDALAMANTIQSIQIRDAALQDIVAAQVRAGSIQEALTAANSIEGERRRRSAVRIVASAQIQVANQHLYAGNLQDALTTAEQIPDASARDQIFAAVANNQLATEHFTDAVRTAQGIQDPTARDPVLARTAVTQLQKGDAQAASATAKLIQTAGTRDQVLQEFVRVQTQAGDLQGALTFARSIENINTRDGRLNTIAQKHVEVGNLDQALSIAKLMRTGMRDQVLELMVKAYTRDKDLGNALALAKLIASDNTRQTRFYYIAQTQVQAGELQAAAATAQLMQPGDLRDRILQAVGQSK